MSPEHRQAPDILSGPFGSFLHDTHGIATSDAFAWQYHEIIETLLRAYAHAGVTQPVTPTFGAAARGPHGGKFDARLRDWNVDAGELTQKVFSGAKVLGSVAPLLDTSGGDDLVWLTMHDRKNRSVRIHTPQIEALRRAGVGDVLGEAFHDFDDAGGMVIAAENAGMDRVIVSFEPTARGVPHNMIGIASFADVADALRDATRGRINVGVGLNCGHAGQILDILSGEPRGTFDAVYPNYAEIPHDERGTEFRRLADLNEKRTPAEEARFAVLRREYAISQAQRTRLIRLCHEKNVPSLGLCCGSSPTEVGELAMQVHDAATPSSSPREPLEV